MTLEHYSYLAEILGVIAILITLIYLSVQVRQGANLLRSEARQAQIDNDQNNISQFVDFPELGTTFYSREPPTFEEKVRLTFWIIGAMRAREHEWLQYRAGNLDETSWLSYRNVIIFILGTERTRALWELITPNFNNEFVAMVKEMMDDTEPQGGDIWEKIDQVV